MIPKLRAHVFTVIFPIFKKGMEPSSFYGSSRISCHSRLPEAVRKVDIEKRTATAAIIGSLDGGKNRDIEIGSENDMRYTVGLPDEIAGEIDVFMKKVVMRVSKQWFRFHRKKKQKTDVLREQNFKATGIVRNRVVTALPELVLHCQNWYCIARTGTALPGLVLHCQIINTVTVDQKDEALIFSRTKMWKWWNKRTILMLPYAVTL